MRFYRHLVVGAVACATGVTVAQAATTVTEYAYNDDGALTAVVVQVDDDPPRATFLTYDNFEPDPSDPTTGQVAPGTGTMSAIGPAPGTDTATERFVFDPRDRLLSYSGPAGEQTYDYHAKGGMASASIGSDTLFFFQETGETPKITNIRQSATGRLSGYLGRARYLNDGSEELLLNPRRKDVACTYSPDGETLQSYVYDAYGASPLLPPDGGSYDLGENPFRYTGEYRDPVWGGYYLRARWYHPDYAVFLSRDSMSNLSRYGYTSGNPVMRADPTGLRFHYMHDIGNPVGKFLKKLNKGVVGHFARFFLSPVLGPLQIIANPGGFWHAVKTNQNGIDVFLALGVVSEVVGGYVDSAFAAAGTSYLRRFLTRAVADTAIGLGQTTAVAARRGFQHFDWNTFVQGAEITAGAIFYRGVLGANIRKTRVPQANAGPVANNVGNLAQSLTHSPPETSFSPQGLVRSESYEPPFIQDHDDNLLSIVDDGEFERNLIERQVKARQQDFQFNRQNTLSEIRQSSKAQLRGRSNFLNEVKGSATRVSRATSFEDLAEEDGASMSAFSNNAANHSHAIIEELQDE